MLIKEIMKPDVVTIDAQESVLSAANKYRDYKIGCLIVTVDGKCAGIVTERDIIERTICELLDPKVTKVGEIMSSDIKTVHSLDKLEKAINVMVENNIKKLPVIQNNNIVGIVTVTDISRARPDLSDRFIESWIKPIWRD